MAVELKIDIISVSDEFPACSILVVVLRIDMDVLEHPRDLHFRR
jgi:hypothetical protein